MNAVTTKATVANTDILEKLHQWSEAGWLRRLDSAMASFMQELDPSASAALLVSTAVLAQMEGRGHTCLPLRLLVAQPIDMLAWPQSAQEEVTALWQTLPTNPGEWISALRASHLVRVIGLDEDDDHGQPLVLSGTASEPLLYLRRYWLHEHQVAQQIKSRTGTRLNVDESLARQWLDRLFAEAAGTEKTGQMDWQKMACAIALRSGLTVITGGPGTGKTYTAARLLALLFAMHAEPQRLRVGLAAPTGKAAARLRQSIDFSLQDLSKRLGGALNDALDLEAFTKRIGPAKTLHSLLGARPDTRHFIFNANNPLDVDILIVDEASMIHLEMMSALLQALPAGAKLILLGDKDQLASVEAGAVLGDLCRDALNGCYDAETVRYAAEVAGVSITAEYTVGSSLAKALAQQTVMLRESRRFGGLIGQLALAVNASNTELVQSLFENDASAVLHASCSPTNKTVLDLAVRGRDGASACYTDYLHLMNARPPAAKSDADSHAIWAKDVLTAFERFRILCVVHEGEWGTLELNKGVQQALANAGLLKPSGEWFAGRAIMVTRNDTQLGVSNGDVGVTLPAPDGSNSLRVYFLVGDKLRSVGVSRLSHVETAFAMTVHKCQGSEFLHTALVLPHGGTKIMTRELVYTGITRARSNFTLVEAQAGLLRMAITQQSLRASGLCLQLASD